MVTEGEDGSELSVESGEESSESEATPPPTKKQKLLQSAPSGRDCAMLKVHKHEIILNFFLT